MNEEETLPPELPLPPAGEGLEPLENPEGDEIEPEPEVEAPAAEARPKATALPPVKDDTSEGRKERQRAAGADSPAVHRPR